ncbi:MAG TPA: hypothetical protein K8U77_04060 [Slackia equolifaciens]|uniref:Uncharacterized protein n=1 Tax=Slackia equolifaciens TaxID=498718 RepID=A0A9D2UWL3_9ACTN|nr:hypothetical protein [Slackia equolifaciens]
MKEFVESLGGAFWATFTALSVIVTVALGFGLPKLVDTSNPWVVFIACSLVFIVGFFNGWKQRGFKSGRDMELADRLERERLELAKSNEAEIARINAEKELEIDRRNREEREQAKICAIKGREEERRRQREEVRTRLESLSSGQMALIGKFVRHGNVCKLAKKDTDAALLQSLGILQDLSVTDPVCTHWKLSEAAIAELNADDSLMGKMRAAESKERETGLLEAFERAEYRVKLLAALLYKTGGMSVTTGIFGACFDASFMDYSVIEDNMRDVWLKEDMKAMLDNNQNALAFYDPSGDEIEWLKSKVLEASRRWIQQIED